MRCDSLHTKSLAALAPHRRAERLRLAPTDRRNAHCLLVLAHPVGSVGMQDELERERVPRPRPGAAMRCTHGMSHVLVHEANPPRCGLHIEHPSRRQV
eukprot:scaffold90185_cov31-Tisochrysis_lutea.AAC.1